MGIRCTHMRDTQEHTRHRSTFYHIQDKTRQDRTGQDRTKQDSSGHTPPTHTATPKYTPHTMLHFFVPLPWVTTTQQRSTAQYGNRSWKRFPTEQVSSYWCSPIYLHFFSSGYPLFFFIFPFFLGLPRWCWCRRLCSGCPVVWTGDPDQRYSPGLKPRSRCPDWGAQ